MLEVLSNFAGLNTLSDPMTLPPTKSPSMVNLYPQGGNLVTRPFLRQLSDYVSNLGFSLIVSVYYTRRDTTSQTGILYILGRTTVTDPNHLDLFEIQYNLGSRQYISSYNRTPLFDFTGSAVTYLKVTWLYHDYKLYILMYNSLTDTSQLKYNTGADWESKPVIPSTENWKSRIIRLTFEYHTFNEGVGGLEPGAHEYALVFYRNVGEDTYYFKPILWTVGNQIYNTIELFIHFLVSNPLVGYGITGLAIYRKDYGDEEYWYVDDATWNSVQGQFEYVDHTPKEEKDEDKSLPDIQVFVPTGSLRTGTFFQGRAIWVDTDYRLWFSVPEDALVVNSINSLVSTIQSGIQVTDLIDYMGTLVIFTKTGIYHLVGVITDEDITSNYQIYKAVPDICCASSKVLFGSNDLIYFIAEDGVYAYNLSLRQCISEEIRPTFLGLKHDNMILIEDKVRKLIYLIEQSSGTVYAYHYSNQSLEPYQKQIGTWYPFVFNISILGGLSAPIHAATKNIVEYPVFFSSVAVIAQLAEDYIVKGYVESYVAFTWTSPKLVLDSVFYRKRWQEFRLMFESIYALPTNLSFEWLTDEETAGKDVYLITKNCQRIRLRNRGRYLEFAISATMTSGKLTIIGYAIKAGPVGRT